MNKVTIWILSILLGSVFGYLGFFLGNLNAPLPTVLYQAPKDDANLLQWRRDWTKATDSIVSAKVISAVGDEVYVYIDYIYSGRKGEGATVCGSIISESHPGNWGCAPVGIGRGRGFGTIRFMMIKKAPKIACSDEVRINFYGKDGIPFLNHTFVYEKTWIRGEKGFKGKLKEYFADCS